MTMPTAQFARIVLADILESSKGGGGVIPTLKTCMDTMSGPEGDRVVAELVATYNQMDFEEPLPTDLDAIKRGIIEIADQYLLIRDREEEAVTHAFVLI